MQEEFPGYFRPSNEEFKELWRSALIIPDANILLNLYRYSAETRKEFLRVLRSFRDRLWLPRRVAEEFFRNRVGVIAQQEKTYEEAAKSLEKTERDFQNKRQHPFLSNELLERLMQVHKEVRAELNASRTIHLKLITEDTVLSELDELFRGRIGPAFTSAETEQICNEGKQRYERKVPPGYKDSAKDETEDATRRFGDLIAWKQVLEKAKADSRPIILLLDDRKEDWWVSYEGRTIGPRPELIAEFMSYSGQNCYLYQPDSFLSFSETYGKGTVSAPALSEVKELRHVQEVERKRARSLESKAMLEDLLEKIAARRRDIHERLGLNAADFTRHLALLTALKRRIETEDPSAVVQSEWDTLERIERRVDVLSAERENLIALDSAVSADSDHIKKQLADF